MRWLFVLGALTFGGCDLDRDARAEPLPKEVSDSGVLDCEEHCTEMCGDFCVELAAGDAACSGDCTVTCDTWCRDACEEWDSGG